MDGSSEDCTVGFIVGRGVDGTFDKEGLFVNAIVGYIEVLGDCDGFDVGKSVIVLVGLEVG